MQYRSLGLSGLEVSALAFGAWQIGDPDYWGADERTDADAAVQTAIDGGINLFDTAESYGGGESERALGKALGKRRGGVLIASKVNPEHCAPDALRAACEGSLQRLGTDYLDLYQVHWPPREVPWEDVAGALERLREEGKIRAAGLSNFGRADLEAWLACGSAASNQIGYNMLFRASEYEIAPLCRDRGVGILAYMPLLQGLLTGRWQSVDEIPAARRRSRHFSAARAGTRHGEPGCEPLLMDTLARLRAFCGAIGLPMAAVALNWVMTQPGITSVIVGARNPAQLKRNLDAAELDVGPAGIAQLNEITAPMKRALGRNADPWEAEANSRIR